MCIFLLYGDVDICGYHEQMMYRGMPRRVPLLFRMASKNFLANHHLDIE